MCLLLYPYIPSISDCRDTLIWRLKADLFKLPLLWQHREHLFEQPSSGRFAKVNLGRPWSRHVDVWVERCLPHERGWVPGEATKRCAWKNNDVLGELKVLKTSPYTLEYSEAFHLLNWPCFVVQEVDDFAREIWEAFWIIPSLFDASLYTPLFWPRLVSQAALATSEPSL